MLMKKIRAFLFCAIMIATMHSQGQATDTIVLRDIQWSSQSPAGMTELFIPSGGSLLQGFIYTANGEGKHPTLILLHGYPGNERNLDLAQVVRARGWNAIYFDYRGSWGSQGHFSFANCVEDVKNVVAFCKKYSDSLHIDTGNLVLFGHSMGGWVCLKALEQLPDIKKGFVLSAWNIGGELSAGKTEQERMDIARKRAMTQSYFVLNTPVMDILLPAVTHVEAHDLVHDGAALSNKQIIMLDENARNRTLAEALRQSNRAYFRYEVWPTDHPFTNKRVALMKNLLAFLAR